MTEQYIEDPVAMFAMLDDHVAPEETSPEYHDYSEDEETNGHGNFDDAEELFDEEDIEQAEEEERLEKMDEDELAKHTFDEIPEDAVLTFGDKQMSKKEISELITTNEAVNEVYGKLSGYQEYLEQNDVALKINEFRGKLECSKNIDFYDKIIKDPTKSELDKGKATTNKLAWENNLRVIEDEVKLYADQLNKNKQATIEQRFSVMNHEMSKEIPGWNSGVSNQVRDYIMQSGMTQSDILNSIGKPLTSMAHKAMMYDELVSKSKNTVNSNITKQRATRRNTAASSKVTSGKKSQILNKMQRGEYVDPKDSFAFLED